MSIKRALAALVALLAAGIVPAAAQERFPARQISLVVPLSPGNTVDILARIYADRLTRVLGQPVVVTNRPGAGGAIAAQAVAAAPADGYTLIFGNSGLAILGLLNRNLGFDLSRDLAGIAMTGDTPALVVVSPATGVRTLREFVELARRQPGAMNFASAGNGSATHLSGAYFAHRAGVELTHVPYRVGNEIIADMLSGRVQAVFAPAAFTLALLQDRRLLPLAVATEADMQAPVAVPSARSQGVDYLYSTWYGFFAPARTPRPVMERLAAAVLEAGRDSDLGASVSGQGVSARLLPLEQFDAYIRTEIERLGPVLTTVAQQMQN